MNMKNKSDSDEITQALVNELLDYNPGTGMLVWKRRSRRHFKTSNSHATWNSRYAGCAAGTLDTRGRLQIAIFDKLYLAHRIVFLAIEGRWPKNEIDHINHDALDNRWCNLREVDHIANGRNMSKFTTNTSGITGVFRNSGRWMAAVRVNGILHTLGRFDDIEEAAAVVKAFYAAHGFHKNHGLSDEELPSEPLN